MPPILLMTDGLGWRRQVNLTLSFQETGAQVASFPGSILWSPFVFVKSDRVTAFRKSWQWLSLAISLSEKRLDWTIHSMIYPLCMRSTGGCPVDLTYNTMFVLLRNCFSWSKPPCFKMWKSYWRCLRIGVAMPVVYCDHATTRLRSTLLASNTHSSVSMLLPWLGNTIKEKMWNRRSFARVLRIACAECPLVLWSVQVSWEKYMVIGILVLYFWQCLPHGREQAPFFCCSWELCLLTCWKCCMRSNWACRSMWISEDIGPGRNLQHRAYRIDTMDWFTQFHENCL